MEGQNNLVPEQLRRMLILTLTLIAVALYGAIVISAIVITLSRDDPQFSEHMERAAGLLSGLVGAVVTAGFARSQRPNGPPVSVSHPLAGAVMSNWSRLRPLSLANRNLDSLGDLLGIPGYPGRPVRTPGALPTAPEEEEPGPEAEPVPAPAQGMSARMWIALVYVVVYVCVGLAAFVLAVWQPRVPGIIANSAWVWFGTMISSAYSFFGLDQPG